VRGIAIGGGASLGLGGIDAQTKPIRM